MTERRQKTMRGVIDLKVSCEGKEGLTEKRAREVAKNMHRSKGSRVNAYRCTCGSWHVGSVNAVQRRGAVAMRAARRVVEDDE